MVVIEKSKPSISSEFGSAWAQRQMRPAPKRYIEEQQPEENLFCQRLTKDVNESREE